MPTRCQRCHAVELTIGPDKLERYSCRKGHPMFEECGYFTALLFGRAAVAADAIDGQVPPECVLKTNGSES